MASNSRRSALLLLSLALSVLCMVHGERIFNKLGDSQLVAAGRQLRGCEKTFPSALYEPIKAYSSSRHRGPALSLPFTGWYDLADVSPDRSWDKTIESMVIGSGTLCLLWKDKLTKGAVAKSPPLALGEGHPPLMPQGWGGVVRTIYAVSRQSKEPAFPVNVGKLIGGLRDGYGKDPTPPKLNMQLFSAADGHAVYMFKQDRLTETGPKGSATLRERLTKAGYGPHKAAAQLVVKLKSQDPAQIFNVLLGSKKNLGILLRDYDEIGTGWGWNGDDDRYIYVCIILAKK